MKISFYLNREYVQAEVDPHMTTLIYLREHKGLTGVKESCNEGDCGACVIALGEQGVAGMRYYAVNSCLYPVVRLHGKHVVTLEGIQDAQDLHPLQAAMEKEHGAQCGFCTSGIILSLFCLFQRNATPTDEEIIQALDGSLCRCTGYASILRAAHSLAEQVRTDETVADRITPAYFADISKQIDSVEELIDEQRKLAVMVREYFVPEDLHELFEILENIDDPAKLTLINGDTDIMVGVNLGKFTPQKIVDMHRIREFTRILRNDDLIAIGARATLSDVLEHKDIRSNFPALTEAVAQMCSTPIRNVATLTGNVCTASPIADAIPPLLAYDAIVVAQSIKGTRRVALRDWFKSYRKTALGYDEVVIAIELPFSDCQASFEKTGKRKTLDIATVNSALAIQVKKNHFETVRLFYGGVAAVPFEAEMTAEYLVGKEANEAVIYEASRIAAKEISPLGDVRGSLEFRRQLAANHLVKHFTKLMPSLFK